ncbi:hypothetical protein SAMN02799624_01787 [Paenibacillus sp. UNC496MF]|uniref:hypothetical protein n=1 Tax=Paenibacillus sp. UNC496MF TaxID=1502753 RepID=UPI0008E7A082|nr:hypothetical protein [Paenibacillus sp. UNC496MF]SFI70092.1 hypothetical protein SAMN02799624_01787 [Paenibacillus sp. UNC496MF]
MRKNVIYLLCLVFVCSLFAGCSAHGTLPNEPIRPTIRMQNQSVDYLLGQYCWYGSEAEGVCGDPPHPDAFYASVQAKAVVGSAEGTIGITFPIQPDECTLTVIRNDGTEETISVPDPYRYPSPAEPGYYRYRLSAVWDQKNNADYHFGLLIKE